MTHEDNELRDLLRRVDVPPEMIARLRAIPDADRVSAARTAPRWPTLTLRWAMAAGIFGLAAFVGWYLVNQLAPQPNERITKREPSLPTISAPTNATGSSTTDPALSGIDANIALVNEQFGELKLDGLRRKKSNTRPLAVTSPPSTPDLDSLIITLADQSALDWGADISTVEHDLNRVIERFPGTPGAEMAAEFLKQRTF